MWADTLLHAEQRHLIGLLFWAAGSLIGGTTVGTFILLRRVPSPLLRHFALQLVAWGAAEMIVGTLSWRSLALRDVARATRLERMLWLNLGIEAGLLATGVTLALTAWVSARRLAPIGAGIAIVLHALALLVLDLQLVAVVSR